jgi:hypothetical protein
VPVIFLVRLSYYIEEFYFLSGYNAKQFGKSQPTFRRNISPLSSGLASSICSVPHAAFLLGLIFSPEDGEWHVPPKRDWLSTHYKALNTQVRILHSCRCLNLRSQDSLSYLVTGSTVRDSVFLIEGSLGEEHESWSPSVCTSYLQLPVGFFSNTIRQDVVKFPTA